MQEGDVRSLLVHASAMQVLQTDINLDEGMFESIEDGYDGFAHAFDSAEVAETACMTHGLTACRVIPLFSLQS
jgi:hypothetical protein